MNISYDTFPLLLFCSFTRKTAPDGLPFEAESEEGVRFMANTISFADLFAFITVSSEFKRAPHHVNYLLSDPCFHRIDSNDNFRNLYFSEFFRTYIKGLTGTILFKDGGQYVFMLLGKHETKNLKNSDGRYICTALFNRNTFIGFEEAIITEAGLKVSHTGYYPTGMDLGGYLSFVAVFLAYTNEKGKLPVLGSNMNPTSETIHFVD